MKYIVYTTRDQVHRDALLRALNQVQGGEYQIVYDLHELFQIIRSRFSGWHIVLLVSTQQEMDILIENRRHLANNKLIFIFTYEDQQLISKGLSLSPRFVSQVEYGFKDVAGVMEKIIRNVGKKNLLHRESVENDNFYPGA